MLSVVVPTAVMALLALADIVILGILRIKDLVDLAASTPEFAVIQPCAAHQWDGAFLTPFIASVTQGIRPRNFHVGLET